MEIIYSASEIYEQCIYVETRWSVWSRTIILQDVFMNIIADMHFI